MLGVFQTKFRDHSNKILGAIQTKVRSRLNKILGAIFQTVY